MTFKEAMYAVLMAAGDTDTNAAIVGAVMGAWLGKSGIEESWVEKVCTYNNEVGRKRPDWLLAKNNMDKLNYVIHNAPSKLKV